MKHWFVFTKISIFFLCFVQFPAVAQRRVDLSRLVVVGDSLSAGFQDFSLVQSAQVNSYANLIARQAGTPLVLPLIGEPGVPAKLIPTSVFPFIGQAPGVSPGRLNPMEQATNLAVPGQTLQEVLFRKPGIPNPNSPDGIQLLTDLVLGFPGILLPTPVLLSQVEWVERFAQNPATRPTFIIAWAGNNDALFSILGANPNLVTPVPVFENLYGQFLSRLRATGATLVVANIPDVTAVPYLTPARDLVPSLAQGFGMGPGTVYRLLQLQPGDYLVPGALAEIAKMVAARSLQPLPSMCAAVAPGMPFPQTACVLRADQVRQIQSTVDQYNRIIARAAANYGAVLVDIQSLMDRVSRHGYIVNGQRLTTELGGGLFSLDAIHPTTIGQAVLADEFITTMNRTLGTSIPLLGWGQIGRGQGNSSYSDSRLTLSSEAESPVFP